LTKQQKSTKRNWAEKQIKALIELGDDPLDAERFVRLALARTPEGVSPEEVSAYYDAGGFLGSGYAAGHTGCAGRLVCLGCGAASV